MYHLTLIRINFARLLGLRTDRTSIESNALFVPREWHTFTEYIVVVSFNLLLVPISMAAAVGPYLSRASVH